ncbi:MAG: TlpA family protein disulfide reductase [Bacteroidetes bacterium]|nr:TlpA family protein disulfide reductase [Bacteroidota bacterium]
MKYILAALAFICVSNTIQAQQVVPYNADKLVARISNSDTFYIVNFWATWCGPCVKELPEFAKLETAFKGKPVKVLLVSLDFKEAYPNKLEKFISKKKIAHEVVWFNETNANEFIPKIDNRWQGSIPTTLLMYKKNEYSNLFEGSITSQMLIPLIGKQLSL